MPFSLESTTFYHVFSERAFSQEGQSTTFSHVFSERAFSQEGQSATFSHVFDMCHFPSKDNPRCSFMSLLSLIFPGRIIHDVLSCLCYPSFSQEGQSTMFFHVFVIPHFPRKDNPQCSFMSLLSLIFPGKDNPQCSFMSLLSLIFPGRTIHNVLSCLCYPSFSQQGQSTMFFYVFVIPHFPRKDNPQCSFMSLLSLIFPERIIHNVLSCL